MLIYCFLCEKHFLNKMLLVVIILNVTVSFINLPQTGILDHRGDAVDIKMMMSRMKTSQRTWKIPPLCQEWRKLHCQRMVSLFD